MARIWLVFMVISVGFLAARMLLGSMQPGTGRGEGDTFRPDARGRKRERTRQPPPTNARSVVRRSSLVELRDALSGGPLDADGELFRCADCQSFYGVASVRALAMDNAARCINCGSIHRIAVEVVD